MLIDVVLVSHRDYGDIKGQIAGIAANTDSTAFNLIVTGLKASASHNRNRGLSVVKSDIFVMMDDDIFGFYKGWLGDLIKPLVVDSSIIIASARLLNSNGCIGPMMGNNQNYSEGWYDASPSGYKGYKRLPTACLVVRKNGITFDENFIGSGYEDTDYMNKINVRYPDKRIVINNNCKLVHLNEEKNQGGIYFEHNKKYYLSLYPDDASVLNQVDWTRRR